MFNSFKNILGTLYSNFKKSIGFLKNIQSLDQATLNQLEKTLLEADIGIETTRLIIKDLTTLPPQTSGEELARHMNAILEKILTQENYIPSDQIFLLVGINGSGKTTTAGKLAHYYRSLGKKVLLVAGDTFRAAATEQLNQWAQKTGADIVMGKENQDPASVIYVGCQEYLAKAYDILIIDTAGRLQTKVNLMKELEKIKRIIQQQLPDKKLSTLLVVDGILGQNSLIQAQLFHESTPLDGVVLTKMDGSAKGGIIFSITSLLHIPIAYISYGEKLEHLEPFNAHAFVESLLAD
ncbi:MAG: signal recognition particle-docking protein FtsY [Candidatus Babeliaceae bacterium]|jgi:fused signal recognition particle receptor